MRFQQVRTCSNLQIHAGGAACETSALDDGTAPDGRSRTVDPDEMAGAPPALAGRYPSKEKIRRQSRFMLMMVQLWRTARSYISWLNVPTEVAGRPVAGP